MKTTLTLIFLLLSTGLAVAQSSYSITYFGYDDAGNRVSRTIP